MADYKKIASVIKSQNKGYSWSINNITDPPCDLGTTDTKGIFGVKKNNTSYGITYDTFVQNANSLGYVASCENFKNMPDTIYNVIFKKVYWDAVKGDQIKNQAVANALVENKGIGIAKIFTSLEKLGYKRPYISGKTIAENINNNFTILPEDVAFINKVEDEGNSNLLFDELKQEKDKVYVASKLYALTISQKVALGFGVLLVGYIAYKIIKR